MKPYHSVVARLNKRWFLPPVMVYDIIHNYTTWYDPSFGNGGGDYIQTQRKIATFLDQAIAEEQCVILNKFNGENK